MSHCCLVHTYVVSVIEFQEFLPGELCAIIRDDGVGHSNSMDNVCEEQHCLFGHDSCDGSDLNPLEELIDHDKQVGEAPRCFL